MKKFIKRFLAILLATILILCVLYRNRILLLYNIYKNYTNSSTVSLDNISPDSDLDMITEDADAEMDITYKNTNSKPLTLDLYKPKKQLKNGSPVLLYVHGGSWTYGDKGIPSMLSPLLDSFRDQGYSIISISYELLNYNINFYKQVADVKDSIRWINKNKDKYNFDTDEIGLIGISAGAHLSLLAAYSADDNFTDDLELKSYPCNVNFLVDFFGPTDLNTLDASLASKEMNISINSIKNKDEIYTKYSPINYIKKDLPKTLIIHSKSDTLVPYENSLNLYNKSKAEGNDVHLLSLEDMNHDLSNLSEEDSKKIAFKTLFFIINNSPL
ncbi:MAG: alpha/beta hydrolase [Clostridiaceae bacterium]|nr:alpha/beta hydrolase [Clostridiaceae bacterium]